MHKNGSLESNEDYFKVPREEKECELTKYSEEEASELIRYFEEQTSLNHSKENIDFDNSDTNQSGENLPFSLNKSIKSCDFNSIFVEWSFEVVSSKPYSSASIEDPSPRVSQNEEIKVPPDHSAPLVTKKTYTINVSLEQNKMNIFLWKDAKSKCQAILDQIAFDFGKGALDTKDLRKIKDLSKIRRNWYTYP